MQPPRKLADRMLRNSLERPANLHDFLESALPKEVNNLDFGGVRVLPREFFTADWHEREADLVFEIPYRLARQTVPALVGVMLEHQSDTDTAVPLRALFNLMGFWERHWRQWTARPRPRGPLLLPPVYSVVLYTGEVAWGSNTNIREMLAEPATFHSFAPDWGPVFWDLAGRTPEELLAGGPWMQLMAVMRMTAAEQVAFERVFREAVRHLAALQQSEHVRWVELLEMVLRYAAWRRPETEQSSLREIAERENPAQIEEVRSMVRTIAEADMERGAQRGRLEEARFLLRRLLEESFSPLPEALLEQIAASDDLERLNAAVLRAAKIESLDEFQL
jgi:hypothetical protein